MGLFQRLKNARKSDRFKMVTTTGNSYYAWDGKLYNSDIVRACIKPQTKAIGKAVAKHIRKTIDEEGNRKIEVNPQPYMRLLLEDPNPYMTGQMLQEKMCNQLILSGNAFILIIRDENGYPVELYPIPCTNVETKYTDTGRLWLRFWYQNGKYGDFPYEDVIHIRDDYKTNDIFGEAPMIALEPLMKCVTTIDQGIIKAIKNSGAVRWLLKFSNALRPEDLKEKTAEFAQNYLDIESETFGVAGTDAKADAQRIEAKDYVPNAALIDRITKRIYAFFGVNEAIVHSEFTEEEWNAFYEARCEPVITQMSREFTKKLFSRKQRAFGNEIVFEASNLMFANTKTKLEFVAMVDRGAMTPNEWRYLFNMTPVEGGDTPIMRLDTAKIGGDEGNGNG